MMMLAKVNIWLISKLIEIPEPEPEAPGSAAKAGTAQAVDMATAIRPVFVFMPRLATLPRTFVSISLIVCPFRPQRD